MRVFGSFACPTGTRGHDVIAGRQGDLVLRSRSWNVPCETIAYEQVICPGRTLGDRRTVVAALGGLLTAESGGPNTWTGRRVRSLLRSDKVIVKELARHDPLAELGVAAVANRAQSLGARRLADLASKKGRTPAVLARHLVMAAVRPPNRPWPFHGNSQACESAAAR